MNNKIKNVLDAASKYMDDHEMEVILHSLFAGSTSMLLAYRARRMYRTGKAYYQQAAAANALKKSGQATVSDK